MSMLRPVPNAKSQMQSVILQMVCYLFLVDLCFPPYCLNCIFKSGPRDVLRKGAGGSWLWRLTSSVMPGEC